MTLHLSRQEGQCCAPCVVDTKGVATPAFRLKAKLMKACHGLEIEVVKNG